MPDPHNEPPQSGEIGAGTVHHAAAGAFEEEGLTPEQLDARARNTRTKRKPMGPPPVERDDGVGAFADDLPELPDTPETTPD